MRFSARLASAFAFASLVFATGEAAADTMDPALERLVSDSSCRIPGKNGGAYYNPASGFTPCRTNDAAFAQLVAQYGFAIAPTAMHSARTTGYGDFELSIQASYTNIDSNADYWKNGTQGPQDPTTKNFSVLNKSPSSVLQLYTLNARKGFPFGFEVATNVGFMAQTSFFTLGADVRWSLLEGFRTGIPAIFPDLAVGGSVRTITGTSEMQLTIAGVDGQISKPLPIAGTVVLTPYVGYQFIRIFGDSGLIDLTPNTDASNLCGYSGNNTPATPDPSKMGVYDGQPVCKHGTSADFNNDAVFQAARLNRHRLDFGAQLRFQYLMLGAHFLLDLVKPGDANQSATVTDPNDSTKTINPYTDVARQWTLAFDVGAIF